MPKKLSEILHKNQTETPLGSGETWTAIWEDVQHYNTITSSISTDQDGVCYFEFATVNTKDTADVHEVIRLRAGIPRTFSVKRRFRFFRLRFVNGSTPQTTFIAQAFGNSDGIDTLDADEDNPNSSFKVSLPTVTDMTNRVRIANPNKILETTWQYDLQPRSWSTRVTGSGTVAGPGQKDPAYAKLSTTTASGDKVELRTKRFLLYQPFRTHILSLAVILNGSQENLVKRFGQYTSFNGWYFEQNSTEFYVGYRNNTFENTGTIDTKIERANWNVDRLDGAGPSGLDIDDLLGNALTFIIEFVWHGTQGIRWGIQYFDKLYRCHELVWSATDIKPFARSALLPVSFEMENTGTVSEASDFYVGPMSFNIEGGEERAGLRFSVANGVTGKSVTSTTVPVYILGIRPKTTINSVNNRGSITPLSFNVFSDQDIYYEVYLQAIPTNGTWTSVDTTSITEYSTDFTTLSTVGYLVDSGYVAGGGNRAGTIAASFESLEFVSIDILNSNAQLAIVIRAFKLSNNATVRAAIRWKETY